jgi:acrylyl-CoA reductase (NADPH)
VLVTGCALSETHDGGYAERARAHGDWIIPMPDGLDGYKAMALATAGFTAALAIHRMEVNGQTPPRGPIVVTGAAGGVGSPAIDMLAGRGYEVIGVSGKASAAEHPESLGARQILTRQEIDTGSRPLAATRFAGAIDNEGGEPARLADQGRRFLRQHRQHRSGR